MAQENYDAIYNAARDELQKIGAISEPIQNAARDYFSRNSADHFYAIVEACAAKFEAFLDNNREEIIDAVAQKLAAKGVER